MRLPIPFCMICVAGMLALTSGCDKPAARGEPPPPKVSVAHPVITEMTNYDQYNGWLDATDTVELRARVRGHIQKIHFTDGQLVKKGDLLIELDPRPFEAAVARQTEQKGIFQSQLVAAQKEEARLKELQTRGGASQSQVDKAEADARSLDAQLKSNDQEIIRAGLDLEYSKITSPISGRISRALLSEGNLVNAGGTDPILTTIVSVDPIQIYFNVDERALQRFQKERAREGVTTRPGLIKESQIKIKFGLDTDKGYPYEAVLDFADNQVDKTTGTILVRAVMPDPTGRLTPGSHVRIRIPVSEEHTVELVPDTAVLSDQDKKYLLVLDSTNTVQRLDINPGRLLDDGSRVVLPPAQGGKAISSDDWIIVQGLQMARINYKVDPVKPTTQPAQSQPAVAGL